MARPRKYPEKETLEKAMFLFWRNGYQNTSIKNLEKELNLNAPSIYHSYGSKKQLFISSLDYYIKIIIDQRIEYFFKKDTPPIENINNFFLSLVDDPEFIKKKMGCLFTNTATELGNSVHAVPEISEKIQGGMDKLRSAFYHQLEEARNRKQLESNRDIKELAMMLFVGYQGLLIMLKLNYTSEILRRAALSTLEALDG